MRAKLSLVSIFAAIMAAVMLVPVPAEAESTWDQIKRTGKLRYGAIDYPPNWYRDKTSGKWTGFLVEMVEDVAKEMGVEAVPVETTWATCVLDLQSNKTDLQFGLQATPKRGLVNDFASTALAVTSGRADAMVTAVFGALVAKNRNPDLGDFVLPTPTVYLPSYVGLRREDNNTLQKFLQAWAEWNNLLGYTDARIRKYLESAGATNIPENVRF